MRRSQPCRNSVPLHQTDLWIVAGAVPVSRAVALKETKFPRVWHRVCVCVSHVLLFCTHTHTQECREEVESRVRGRARDLCRVARLRVILRRSR